MEEIILIGGRRNCDCKTLFWKCDFDIEDVEIGDYVIVENGKGYDLVKISGLVKTDDKNSYIFSNNSKLKKAKIIIHKELIEGELKDEQKILKGV